MPITSNAIPARFARLVASPEDFEAAVLTCVTALGAHLGRRSALIHNGTEIYSTLYSLIVTPPRTLSSWYRWFRILEDPPPVTNSGIDRAEAFVHLVRDRVLRPDKVITDRNADPEWRIAVVDAGAAEKRHLIMQRLVRTALDPTDEPDVYETGYWVAPSYAGQGMATEAANAASSPP